MTNRVDESRFFQACFYLMEKKHVYKIYISMQTFFLQSGKKAEFVLFG